jgi:hypothetical protein
VSDESSRHFPSYFEIADAFADAFLDATWSQIPKMRAAR